MEIQADPHLVNRAYQQLLSDAQGQVALLQAVATQLQDRNAELERENQELRRQTGRLDGVPMDENVVTAQG